MDTTVDLRDPSGAAAPTVAPGRARLGYRRELDGLRGVAVILVVVYHVGGVLWPSARSWLLPGGMFGVDLFFVLSGFLITSLLVGEHDGRGRIDLVGFARRRLLRLVPAMTGLLAAVLGLALAGRMYAVDATLSSAGWALTFTANWAMADDRPAVMGHLWSVAVEGQFYAMWSIVVVVALRFRRHLGVVAAIAATGVAAVAWWRYVEMGRGANLFHVYMGTFTRLDAPLVGALAGVAVASGSVDRLRGRAASLVSAVGLVVVVVAAFTLGPFEPVLYRGAFTLVAGAGACAVVGAVRAGDGVLVRALGARPLVLAGMVSYSLYLWHLPIFDWLERATPGWSPVVRSVVGVVAAVAVSTVSYLYVERPFLRRRHRRAAA
ncbi:MAG: acyltransferase [Acidimicrobiales bacterium]|nr:acyltransferase [Acidimicrobiales bacterium]